jgi:hypothetical protein
MQNRRTFLNTVIRGGFFASLAGISGVFIHRWSESEDCRKSFACGNCNLSGRCQLPEADQFRLNNARMNKTNKPDGRRG